MSSSAAAHEAGSIHEAGHLVTAIALGVAVVRASLDGVITRYKCGDPQAHLCEAAIALAGPLAELQYRPPTTPAELRVLWARHWHADLDNASRHLAAIGIGNDDPQTLAQWVARGAGELVRENWSEIERVAGGPPGGARPMAIFKMTGELSRTAVYRALDELAAAGSVVKTETRSKPSRPGRPGKPSRFKVRERAGTPAASPRMLGLQRSPPASPSIVKVGWLLKLRTHAPATEFATSS
jgi:hypothetical protein